MNSNLKQSRLIEFRTVHRSLHRSLFWAAELLLVVSIVAGCGGSDADKAAAQQAANKKKVVKQVQPADPLATMSTAITASKGSLPLTVHFELASTPRVGEPVTIKLAFVPTVDLMAIHAIVKGANGLQVPVEALKSFTESKVGEIKDFSFDATPTSNGIFLANVEVIITRDTGDTTYVFALPVAVPAVAAVAPVAVVDNKSSAAK